MEFRKALLKAASLLALTAAGTVAGQGSADASIAPEDKSAVAKATVSSSVQSDPLFDLMARTNGSFASDAVENALREMYDNPSAARVAEFPNLLASLSGLGAPIDLLERTRGVIADIVQSSVELDDDTRDAVLAELEAGPMVFKLAQLPKDRKRDPDEVGQVPGAAS